MSEPLTNNSSMRQQQSKTLFFQCKVCGDSTRRYYLGVPTCSPCKTFFKRTVEQKQKILRCDFGDQCEINVNNRHICSCCRLRKCFRSGMQSDMLRCSYSRTTKSNRIRKSTIKSLQITSFPLKFSEKLPILNLLTDDQLTLNDEQWNRLFNLCHCYDEQSGLIIAKGYLQDQNVLHPKFRCKSRSLMKLFEEILNTTSTLYQNNPEFCSLSSNDRSLLVQNTMIYTSTLFINFIIHKVRLTNSPGYLNGIGIISHPSIISIVQRLSDQLNFDMTVIKVLLAILSFSTITCTIYNNSPPQTLSNIKQILNIQNIYIDLLWGYLVHKYNYEGAVRCFSNLMRCLFILNECVVRTLDVQWYKDAVDFVVEQTKLCVNLNN